MIRELSSAVLLAGAMLATEVRTNVASDTYSQLDTPLVTFLSSREGFGYGLKATPAKMGAIEAHYAISTQQGEWAYSVLPKFGLSYADGYHELPQTVQFSMGLQGLVSYGHVVVGLEYWHQSNGDGLGLAFSDKQNIGLDIITLQTGWRF